MYSENFFISEDIEQQKYNLFQDTQEYNIRVNRYLDELNKMKSSTKDSMGLFISELQEHNNWTNKTLDELDRMKSLVTELINLSFRDVQKNAQMNKYLDKFDANKYLDGLDQIRSSVREFIVSTVPDVQEYTAQTSKYLNELNKMESLEGEFIGLFHLIESENKFLQLWKTDKLYNEEIEEHIKEKFESFVFVLESNYKDDDLGHLKEAIDQLSSEKSLYSQYIIMTLIYISEEKKSSKFMTSTNKLNFPPLPILVHRPSVIFDRMLNQQGLFIYQIDKKQTIDYQVVFTITKKTEILKQLDQIGINKKFIFPDVDNIASYIKDKHITYLKK